MLFYDNLAECIRQETEKLQKLKASNLPEVGVVLDVLEPNENQDMNSNPGRYSVTRPVEKLAVDSHGVDGDRHRGLTRSTTGRDAPLYRSSGATVVNRRQIFAVSPYECTRLSDCLGVEITPELLGANLVIGREDGGDFSISDVPLTTYLVLADPDADEPSKPPLATLIHYIQQKGCSRTGKAISKEYGDELLIKKFVTHADLHRGILCSVEYPVDKQVDLQRGQRVFFRYPKGSCY
jgi:hypothetical protein